jgi:hypothetical protein
MSIPHALEAAHNALVAKYKENEPTILSLCKTLREDIIPNVLDEMSEGNVEYDIQDLEDWANDTGVGIEADTECQHHNFPQDLSFVSSRFVPFNTPIVAPCSCMCSVTNTRLPSLFKLFASRLYGV